MIVRTELILVLVMTGALVGGCGGSRPDVTTPSAVAPGLESRQSENVPAPESTEPAPPVDRGPAPPTEPPPPPPRDSCNTAAAQWTVGQSASERLLEQAQVAAGASTARFLRPNEPVTLEWLGSRLNLNLDERAVVRSVHCG
jgi:hypothetical protein